MHASTPSGIVRFNIFRINIYIDVSLEHICNITRSVIRGLLLFGERNRAVLLGFAFMILLLLSYFANTTFFKTLNALFQNQVLSFLMIFVHNVIVVSLILVGMTFYVNLVVSDFFKREKYAYVVVDHPRIFAIVFAFIVLFLSILRGATLFLGEIIVEALPVIFLVSAPIGLIEGYGIYLTIKKTLDRTLNVKNLVFIYGIFVIAALIEIGFINMLKVF